MTRKLTPAKNRDFGGVMIQFVGAGERHNSTRLMDAFGIPFSGLSSSLCGFGAHLTRGFTPLMEDQAVEVVGQIGERELCLATGNAVGADEEAVAVLLVGKDMFDVSADR